LTRVERMSKQVAGKPLPGHGLPSRWQVETPGASSHIRESKYCGLESLAWTIETSVRDLESFAHQSESNERNLFQVAGNWHQVVSV